MILILFEAVIGLALSMLLAAAYFVRAPAAAPLAPTPTTLHPAGLYISALTPAATPAAATPGATPTLELTPYTIAEGDTLWDIAIRSRVAIDVLVAANPHLNPNALQPGQQVLIPKTTGGQQAATVHIQAATNSGSSVQLRRGPSAAFAAVTALPGQTPLTVIGRTDDSTWLEAVTADGHEGWVMAQWVTLPVALTELPITWRMIAFVTPTPGGSADALPTLAPAPNYKFIYGIGPNIRQTFLRGQALGNRPNVFSKVGDSITESPAFLVSLGEGLYNLDQYANLRAAIDYFSQAEARAGNSFVNPSLAAKTGWTSWSVINPRMADAAYCKEGEMPLVCEYRWTRPAFSIIMLGTNDLVQTPLAAYELQMRQVIEISLNMGVVPIVSTIPPMHWQGNEVPVEAFNQVIDRLAREYELPLCDYWAALQGLPNEGIASDGIHPSESGGAQTIFTAHNLQYGMTMRNLVTLQAIDAVWRAAGR
jgi:hypothetical protein